MLEVIESTKEFKPGIWNSSSGIEKLQTRIETLLHVHHPREYTASINREITNDQIRVIIISTKVYSIDSLENLGFESVGRVSNYTWIKSNICIHIRLYVIILLTKPLHWLTLILI